MRTDNDTVLNQVEAVLFGTRQLDEIRHFYENILHLQIATYTKEGVDTADVSPSHVNYILDGLLIGFEISDRTDTGGLVVKVSNLDMFKNSVDAALLTRTDKSWFCVIRDPDDRELIIEDRGKT